MPAMISDRDREVMCADSKIGLLATVDESGRPHVTFISSLQPFGSDRMIAGQFCAGLSKQHILDRNRVGFLIFSPEMEIWRGRALYERTARSGPEYEMYNRKPMFRYNSYFGIGLVHYFTLVDLSAKETLQISRVIGGALLTRLFRPFASSSGRGALNDISAAMLGEITGLKFISHLDAEGFPVITPIVQAVNAGRDRVIFATSSYRKELSKIGNGAEVAVFFVNLKMESVLIKGRFSRRGGPVNPYGLIDIERVYNSMPPQPGYIYPRPDCYEKVARF